MVYTATNTNMISNKTKYWAQQLEEFEMNSSLASAANSLT